MFLGEIVIRMLADPQFGKQLLRRDKKLGPALSGHHFIDILSFADLHIAAGDEIFKSLNSDWCFFHFCSMALF
jgi:hypothetical protein